MDKEIDPPPNRIPRHYFTNPFHTFLISQTILPEILTRKHAKSLEDTELFSMTIRKDLPELHHRIYEQEYKRRQEEPYQH
jgi:hypothetical protein|tara:strand:+ start:135 stop:374 length:240 start_codon:yes stop_codon:yes gene_type:complete